MSVATQRRTQGQPRVEIARIGEHLLDGYGSFFGLENPLSKILLVFCTFIFPATGLGGVAGGLSVILARRILRLSSYTEGIEIVNGILLGMLVGSTYALDLKSLALLMFGAIVLVIASTVLTDTLTRFLRLPLLGLPYVIAAYVIMPIGTMLQLLPGNSFHLFPSLWLACPLWQYLPSFGAIYFNGTVVGGLLTFLAFFLSSRYLALLGLASAICGTIFLEQLSLARGLIAQDPLLFLVAQMNGLLTACVVGGLYTIPSKRSIVVALASGLLASALTITLNQILWSTHLPVLALPFVLATYAVLITLSPQHGAAWSVFWLLRPSLAERSLEQIKLAEARGVDLRSVSLKPPFSGTWQVYQGFNGKHTHQGTWRYALDLFQTESNVSYVESGNQLSHYHCYAKPVLSPVYGRVYNCLSTCNDNLPGQVNTVNNWGNYITIEIAWAKYVVLAHLQKDSVRVKPGDYVVPGQMLAHCGNSGRSPQPHLPSTLI
jgi:urea transporter